VPDGREWLRLGTIGVAALIGIPGDVVSLALDRVFAHMDGARQARARELSTRAADALFSLAQREDEGAVESARLTTESLLVSYGLSDERFAALEFDPARAADAVLASRTFTRAEQGVIPLCRRLLICFYKSLLSDPTAFVELLPHSHREQLNRLGRLESKTDRALETLDEMRADLRAAVSGNDREFVQKLINSQVDIARRLIESHRPHAAIELLQSILELAKDRLDARLQFRILSNIGNAHLLLFDARQAGLIFLEAAKRAPEEDQAVAQHAYGHLLLGELDAGERVTTAGTERFPHSGRLQAMRVALAQQRGKLEHPEAAVPDTFRTNRHVAYTVAQAYASRGDSDRAVQWIKVAYEADPNSWQDRKSFAEILLRRAVESNLQLLGGASELKRDFQAAAAELEGIWEVIRAGEPIKASAMIAAQVAMARALAGDRDGARRACDAGLAMGQPPPQLLQVAVKLAEEDRRPGHIIDLLSEVDTSTLPRLDVALGSAQAEVGRTEDALRTLARVAENREAEPSVRAIARANSIEIRARLGISSAVVDEILGMVAAEPDIVPYHVVAASLYEELGQHDDALVQAHVARKLLDEKATLDDWVSVANLLIELDEPAKAAEILGQLAPHPVDSELGRRLLRALLSADRRAALRALLDAMPAGEKTDHFYLWIEAALLERIGQLSKAIDLLTEFLQRQPDAAGLRLNWISLLERSDRRGLRFSSREHQTS
jgi:tetratricopeptide (TPR) repeat protein